jgi:hypothetical protein
MSQDPRSAGTTRLSRRAAVRAGAAAAGLTAGVMGLVRGPARAAAQAAPAGWRAEHLEVDFTPANPVSITLAGGGPPQRGDWFYIDAPIYAAGDVNGTRIGTYECFGAWVVASDDTAAPALRLTTVHFRLDDGSLMGLINEFGTVDPHIGAVQGGTGSYTGALGTFQQTALQVPTPDAPAATPVAGTPTPSQFLVRATFELILPELGA